MNSRDAEFVKYAGNNYLFIKVMYINMLYDLVKGMGGDWGRIKEALIHDPRIGQSQAPGCRDSSRRLAGSAHNAATWRDPPRRSPGTGHRRRGVSAHRRRCAR
ncbi:MAG: hypothetical protein HC788_12440 [Sphingopyxis sp.]|nr:hypothetical protein [Sphingopyxis sp.]